MSRRKFLIALLALAAPAMAAGDVGLQPDQVLISYGLKAGGREISGVSRSLDWSLQAIDAKRGHLLLRVPVASFDSGHPRFDSLLRTALDESTYPYAELDGISSADRFEGMVTIHGVAKPVSVPATGGA